jgi:hypothetical protein
MNSDITKPSYLNLMFSQPTGTNLMRNTYLLALQDQNGQNSLSPCRTRPLSTGSYGSRPSLNSHQVADDLTGWGDF